jgi:cobalt-zinc-cadmium efflux system protein
LGYFGVEVSVGLWSGSLALLADAAHMLTDAAALGLSLAAARIGMRPRSASKTYGYRRAEIIGALVNASAMIVLSLFVMVEAAKRLHSPPAIRGEGVLYTAVIGLAVNVVAAFVLAGSAKHSLNVRSALLHVLGDALGSVAAIVAGACMWFFGLAIADPLASMTISALLMLGSFHVLVEAADVLMEGTPPDLATSDIETTILQTPGVQAVHDLHVWCVTPTEPVLTAHVILTPAAHGTDVAKRVGERLQAIHGLGHVTIQPEAPARELVSLRLPTGKKKV